MGVGGFLFPSSFHPIRIPRGGGCDRLCWDLNSSGKFDTRSSYHKIQNVAPSTFPWKGIWKVEVPKMVAFFMWTAAHGQILTLDNLMLRGRPLEIGRASCRERVLLPV